MTGSVRGKTVVITGASAGIGAAAARALARDGAMVIPIGRSRSKTEALAAELGVRPYVTDFADFASVRRLVTELQTRVDRIDVFAHNAGAMVSARELTVDGHERTIQTNYLGPFLLHALLRRQLDESRARVVVTSSIAHHLGRVRITDLDGERRRYSMISAYATSKLADLLFVRQLARAGTNATGFDPGFLATDFLLPVTGLAAADAASARGMHRVRRILLNVLEPEAAAVGIVRFAAMEAPERLRGRLISPNRTLPSSPTSASRTLARELWLRTEELVRIHA